MTPDRRLDQLEPLVADVLQKVDRLIEGQSQLFDMIVRVDQKADIAIGKADLAAGKADLAAQKADIAAQKADVAAQKADVAAQKADIAAQKADLAARGVAELTLITQQQYGELKAGQQALQAGQDAILQYLKDRLP